MPAHIAIAALVGSLLLASQDNSASPKLFAPEKGGFSVLLPEMPKERVVSGGGEKLTQWYIEHPAGAYVVTQVVNNEMRNADDETADRGLKKGQRAVQSQLKAKLVREQKIKLEGKYPGREFVLEFSDKGKPRLLRSRIYAANGTQFQIILVGDRDYTQSREADQVFNSFRLKK
jgi:hypothetical protein